VRRIAAAAAVTCLAVLAGTARADTFAVVDPNTPAVAGLTGLPSAQTPNLPGGINVPVALSTPPAQPQQLDWPQLQGLWQRAGAAYGIPWQVLASINKIESNLGRNMGPSSAGAIGWMQFMPSTWLMWGTDANGDGVADPWNAEDAVFSAARYLAAAGGATDVSRAVFAYNHADWYVKEVLDLAQIYGQGGDVAFTIDRMQVALQNAEQHVLEANRAVVAQLKLVRSLAREQRPWRAREAAARLLSDRLAAGKEAARLELSRRLAAAEVERRRAELATAQDELEQARVQSQQASFAPGAGTLLQAPSYSGNWVFPVGGGPSVVSVGHTHHDYPAADIAAPAGMPVYALSDALVIRSWHFPDPACGIGLTLQTSDGQTWTYCHLSYEEPGVVPGAQLTAGQIVGLVGSTGHATGPHLHLQLDPTTSYPQDQGWFQAFAGVAFRWQDAATPLEPSRALASSTGGAPVFAVVPDASAQAAPQPADPAAAAAPAVVFFNR
jgi:murein DD-endopeptidase MepM/ murein hydrolase activator NlpD